MHEEWLRYCHYFKQLDELFMTIEQHELIPRLVPANRNRTFDLLDNRWSNHNTRFSVIQLCELYHLLDFPVNLVISNKGNIASSEEAFIITMTKIATGKTNTDLCDMFSEPNDAIISMIYRKMVLLLDGKADGISHGDCLHRWSHLFPDFSVAIRNKLNQPQYGELLFQNVRIIGFLDCKIDETCWPGSGPMVDEELADRWPDADLLQRSVYSGYLRCHGLKVLKVV